MTAHPIARFLRTLARRIAAVATIVVGVLLAAVFAALALMATLAMGAAVWLASRFGLRASRRPHAEPGRAGADVIDVEMREIEEPGSQAGEPAAPGDDAKQGEREPK
jgi:hypothetical protein